MYTSNGFALGHLGYLGYLGYMGFPGGFNK
jgi:hypothetical protein